MNYPRVTMALLNSLAAVEFEQWHKHGVFFRAVSANANGRVNSGILKDSRYFYRKGEEFIWG